MLLLTGCLLLEGRPPHLVDHDGDQVIQIDDCDDADPSVYPGAPESCNGVDDDCDGAVDEAPVDGVAVFLDGDRDGYGDLALDPVCSPAEDQVTIQGDCADWDPDVHPGATEYCNDRDDDCDGVVDEDATDAVAWPVDEDGDGFFGERTVQMCDRPYDGVVGDCDDGDAEVFPGAREICDDRQTDCEGTWDEDAGLVTFYPDGGGTPVLWSGTSYDVDEPGEVWICPGEHQLAIRTDSDLAVRGSSWQDTVVHADAAPLVQIVSHGVEVSVEDLSVRGTYPCAGRVVTAGEVNECRDNGISFSGYGSATVGLSLVIVKDLPSGFFGSAVFAPGGHVELDDCGLVDTRGTGVIAWGGSVVCRDTVISGSSEHAIDVSDDEELSVQGDTCSLVDNADGDIDLGDEVWTVDRVGVDFSCDASGCVEH